MIGAVAGLVAGLADALRHISVTEALILVCSLVLLIWVGWPDGTPDRNPRRWH